MHFKKIKKLIPVWASKSQQLGFLDVFMKKNFGTDLLKELEENYEKSLKNYELANILGLLFNNYITPEEIVYLSILYKDKEKKEVADGYLVGNIPQEYSNSNKPRLSWKLIYRNGTLGFKTKKFKNDSDLIERSLGVYKTYFQKAKILVLIKSYQDSKKKYAFLSCYIIHSDSSLHSDNGDFLPLWKLIKELGLDKDLEIIPK